MSEIIYYLAASLDGFIATPDGGVEWLAEFEAPGKDFGYSDFYQSIDALFMGRRTYEQVLSFGEWPYPGKPSWIFSRRPLAISTPDITLADKNPKELLPELEKQDLHRFWLVGGASLAASFRAQGLINEMIITIMPVILGGGIPIFDPEGPGERLALLDSKKFENDIMQLHYGKVNFAKQSPFVHGAS
jgi:dihydrofolate reductase